MKNTRNGTIYTFYSYKGGVGRTMALANIAMYFFKRPNIDVIMIDWDLEAPGLERFFEDRYGDSSEHLADHPGLADLIQKYKNNLSNPPGGPEASPYPSLSDYMIDLESEQGSRLRLMTAGQRGNPESWRRYASFIQSFDWSDFYENWSGGGFMEWLRDELRQMADVILIDSRTGVTEMGGIATQHMADIVVALTAPNDQNLDGTHQMIQAFNRDEVLEMRDGRKLQVVVVPTRLDNSETKLRNAFQKRFESVFDTYIPPKYRNADRTFWDLRLPYIPQYAYRELLAIEGENANEELVKAYTNLAINLGYISDTGSKLYNALRGEFNIFRTRRIYISYGRSDDEPFVQRLVNDLTQLGFDTWYDRLDMTTDGREFTQVTADAIRGSERLLLIVGPGAIQSDFVKSDWELALSLCIPILPIIRLGDFSYLPMELAQFNAINFRDEASYKQRLNDLTRILNDPVHPLAHLAGVPPLPMSFVPRVSLLHELKTMIGSGDPLTQVRKQHEMLSLVGIGGIGKTVIAAALCHDCVVRRTFEQIIWIDIGQSRTSSDVPNLMRSAVGGEPTDYDSLENARHSFSRELRGRRTLIILDDVWDAGIAKAFGFGGIDVRVLITTRQKKVADNLQANTIRIDSLSDEEAHSLLEQSSRRDQLADEAQTVIDMLGGHSLAISLAGAWLARNPGKSIADLLKRLERRPDFRDLELDSTDKNLNLELAMRVSYDDLSIESQRHLRALGVLARESSADLNMLQHIWSIADELDAEDAVRYLIDAGLVSQEADRYRQHPLVRAYAAALLQETNEADVVSNRYTEYITEQAALFSQLPPEEWHSLDFLLPHVDQVGDMLVESWYAERSDPGSDFIGRVSDFAINIYPYVQYRPQAILTDQGTRLRGMTWLEAGLAASRAQGHQRREAILLSQIAQAWSALGEKRRALEFYEQTVALDRASGDQRGQAITLTNTGAVWDALGEKRKALDYYEQALPLLQAVGDRGGKATTLNNIGRAWDDLGEKRKALDYYEQALPLLQAVGDRSGEATTLNNIGRVWDALGEKRKALDYYEQALPLHRAVGDRGGEAATLNNIGGAWSALGEKRRALEFYEQALPLRRVVGDRSGEAATLNNIGGAWSALGEKRRALEFYEQALPLSRAVNDRSGEAATLTNIGSAWSALGEVQKALAYYEAALPLQRAIGDRGGEATTLNNIGYTYFQQGNLEKVVEVQRQSIEIARSVEDAASEALYLLNSAVVYQRMGRTEEAIQSAEAGRSILLKYNLPQNAGGGTLAQYDALLAQLRGETSPQTQATQQDEIMRQLIQLYAEGGADGVRELLREQADENVIEGLIEQLETKLLSSVSSTLPVETIQQLASNTIAVMITSPEKRDEWQKSLSELGVDLAKRGDDWKHELSFVNALLAIVKGEAPTLAPANPYGAEIERINEAVSRTNNDQ